jgi:type IV pilus assembly protein PilW
MKTPTLLLQHFSSAARPARGFGLVELMVGMLIGLIGVIVVFQTFAVAEGYKRTTTSGADAQQNGSIALYYIERDLRMAGYGINNPALLGCQVNAYDAGPPERNFNFRMTPVVITDGASGAPDSIQILAGSSALLPSPTELIQTMVSATSSYRVSTRFGFLPGDLVIAGQTGSDCSLAQVTGLPTGAGQTDQIDHNTGSYIDANGGAAVARYNKAAGLGVSYNAFDYTSQNGGRMFNLGPAPGLNQYAVTSSQLMQTQTLQGTAASSLADNIVQLQAQYGKDLNGSDGIVDTWDATMPATPTAADWAAVLAVRIAIVARSGLREKPNPATGACDTTTTTPSWAGGSLDLSADPDWRCYRYRIFETTVPLRNLIWRPT